MQTAKTSLLNATLRWFLLALYLAELGASVGQIGLTFTVAALVPLALQIFGGWLSDSIGRLRTIAIGSVAASFGYVLLPLAPSWKWALLALCLEYIAGSMVGPSFGAFIADQSAEENRGRVFGLTKGIFLTVAVIGPLLGGFLAQRFGFRPMLLTAAVLYVSASVLRVWMATTARFARGVATERPTWRSLRAGMGGMIGMLAAGGVLTWILFTDGVRDVAFSLSGELQPLYLAQIGHLDVQQIGWLRALLGAAMIAATFLAGWLSDRSGERRVIAGGFFLQFLSLVVFLRATDVLGFAASALIFGLGIGTMIPAYDALISKVVPEKRRGIAFGLFGTSLGVISLPAPWIGAQLWERFSPRLPFALTAVAALLSVIPAWTKFVLPDKEEGADSSQPGD